MYVFLVLTSLMTALVSMHFFFPFVFSPPANSQFQIEEIFKVQVYGFHVWFFNECLVSLVRPFIFYFLFFFFFWSACNVWKLHAYWIGINLFSGKKFTIYDTYYMTQSWKLFVISVLATDYSTLGL